VLLHVTNAESGGEDYLNPEVPLMLYWIDDFYQSRLTALWMQESFAFQVPYNEAVHQYSLLVGKHDKIKTLRSSKAFQSEHHCVHFFFSYLFPLPDLRAVPEILA
jgi:hypothetical protein